MFLWTLSWWNFEKCHIKHILFSGILLLRRFVDSHQVKCFVMNNGFFLKTSHGLWFFTDQSQRSLGDSIYSVVRERSLNKTYSFSHTVDHFIHFLEHIKKSANLGSQKVFSGLPWTRIIFIFYDQNQLIWCEKLVRFIIVKLYPPKHIRKSDPFY